MKLSKQKKKKTLEYRAIVGKMRDVQRDVGRDMENGRGKCVTHVLKKEKTLLSYKHVIQISIHGSKTYKIYLG